TVRITVFSLSIPLLIGYLNRTGNGSTVEIAQSDESLSIAHGVFFLIVIISTLFIERIYHFPGGTLIFSIVLGFVLSEYIVPIESVPRYISGMGQAAIGAFVGIRFDRKVLNEIVKIGPITLAIVGTFVILSF